MQVSRFLILVAQALAVLAFWFAPTEARAHNQAHCAVPETVSSARDLERIPVARLACAPRNADLDERVGVVRFEPAGERSPRYIISRAAKFSQISIGVVTAQGTVWSHRDFDRVEATYLDRQFAVPLPDYKGEALAVYVAVEHATQATTFDHMRIATQLPGTSKTEFALLLVVALCTGMMLMPIIFDCVFYPLLREKFILWHAAFVACLVTQLVCSFGLYTAFFDVHLPLVRILTIGSFNLMVVTGVIFTLRFIEPDKRSPRLAQAVIWLTAFFSAASIVHMAGIEALGRWPSVVFFLSGAPLGLSMLALIVQSLRNGSHSARFLIVGISPLLLVAMIRVLSFVLPGVPVVDANELLLVATLIEVSATGMGVLNRFVAVKRERDRAKREIDALETVAQHDALTGLLNRRAIDRRFSTLRAQGFDTFAVLDLDHFKDVNDRYGHQIGDRALVACANCLRGGDDRDTISVRLGGEEFFVLMRGKRTVERLEALRQLIPVRIAREVDGLDRPVTASMGVIELPRTSRRLMDFSELYSRADQLLYEAKESGRNRMCFERLVVFNEAPEPRPASEAA